MNHDGELFAPVSEPAIEDCTYLPLLFSQAGETEARAVPWMRRGHAEALMFLLLMFFYCYSPEILIQLKWAEIPLHRKELMAHFHYQAMQT